MAEKEITWQEAADWLESNRRNSAWLAKTLGVSASTPSRWSKGDPIPEPSQHLLRLLIRGELPPGFGKPRDEGVLAFTQAEWRIIEICSVREGYADATAWIVAKIRAYLAMSNQLPNLTAVDADRDDWRGRDTLENRVADDGSAGGSDLPDRQPVTYRKQKS